MLKERITSNLTVPYDYYLADLFREIEDAGCCAVPASRKKLTWVGTHGVRESDKEAIPPKPAAVEAVSFSDFNLIPPIPRIFEQLPLDALTNIRWGVKMYSDYLKPLGEEELSKRANALYAMAQESAKNQGEDEKSGRAVEKHLTMTMLANRRESQQEDAHLHFFLLALMRTGALRHTLEGGGKSDASPDIYEIERSIDRGFNCLRKQEAAKRAYERRQREEKKESRKHGGEGGKETSQRYYGKSKDYVLRRYAEIYEEKNQKGKKISKREIAHTIHKELQQKCGVEIAAECPDWRVLYEKWILKIPAHQ